MHSSLRHLTRPLTLALALAGLGSAPALAQPDRFEPMRVTANQSLGTTALHSASSPKPLTVLASLPITFGLGQWLLQGTDVRLERAAPTTCRARARPPTSPVAAPRRCTSWPSTPTR